MAYQFTESQLKKIERILEINHEKNELSESWTKEGPS